ncbi:hypothetical protein SAMN02800687_0149 [Curtobacterium sp. UNCCL20]|uniref:hypothetical protein n=1 Tax=Curtobacterium sp. UNCCL20 TaxID=1502773 RepID=UPI00088E3D39|nr:hypothetical protein [Curtobacterium sp. UNCCL20]SDQ07270.1 hypothetical protein SAMN02800687_0149 [Curtobacterium sp. UNCCL20]
MHRTFATSHVLDTTALLIIVVAATSACTLPPTEDTPPSAGPSRAGPPTAAASPAPSAGPRPTPEHPAQPRDPGASVLEGAWRTELSRQDLGFAPSSRATPPGNRSGLSEAPEWRMLVFHRPRLTMLGGHGADPSSIEEMTFSVRGRVLTIESEGRVIRVLWTVSMDGLTLTPTVDGPMPPAVFVLHPFAHVHG